MGSQADFSTSESFELGLFLVKTILSFGEVVSLCRQVLASGKEEAGQVLARPSHCQYL